MNEIFWNQVAVTLPIHIVAYIPFLDHLRFGKKRTLWLVVLAEVFYLCLFAVLQRQGVSLSLIQMTAMPFFGGLFFLFVDMEPGKIMFLYTFCTAYLLAVRGLASFLSLVFFPDPGEAFYSTSSTVLCVILFFLTMPPMLWYLKRTARMVFEFNAPDIWKKVWLLPAFNTILVLLFTFSPRSDQQITVRFLLSRIILILSMFLVYFFVLGAIDQLREQAEKEAQAHYLRQIMETQAAQYELLQKHSQETRQARHDLRQHLRAIQGYIEEGNLPALSAYIKDYSTSLPKETYPVYCRNSSVNSLLVYYAQKAKDAGIQLEISFTPLQETIIPEPDFCVLLGNLLENALEACCRQTDQASPHTPRITVHAGQQGNQMMTLTVDNTSPLPPVSKNGHFLSAKHQGFGNGTESIRNIAQTYHGDARFEWKDGIFYASVILNP